MVEQGERKMDSSWAVCFKKLKANNKRGMSLVEVAVAMVLLSVAALGISATIGLVGGKKARVADSGSLEIQGAGYAREVLDTLKNSVGTIEGTAVRLWDSSYGTSCSAAAGAYCGDGTNYTAGSSVNPSGTTYDFNWLAIPAGTGLAGARGTRSYTVWDVSGGAGKVAYKKVQVLVHWEDP